MMDYPSFRWSNIRRELKRNHNQVGDETVPANPHPMVRLREPQVYIRLECYKMLKTRSLVAIASRFAEKVSKSRFKRAA